MMALNIKMCWSEGVKHLVPLVDWLQKPPKQLIYQQTSETSCFEDLLWKLHSEKLQITLLASSTRSSESFTYQNHFNFVARVLKIALRVPSSLESHRECPPPRNCNVSALLHTKILVCPTSSSIGLQGRCLGMCVSWLVFLRHRWCLVQVCFLNSFYSSISSSYFSSFCSCFLAERSTSFVGMGWNDTNQFCSD